jgi:hypothetical protein
MPAIGDGVTVINAMRQIHPKAVTILLSGSRELEAAADATVNRADEIRLAPIAPEDPIKVINPKLSDGSSNFPVESVATILERPTPACIEDWFKEVQLESKLSLVALTRDQRCAHLPQVFSDLVKRLRADLPLGAKSVLSSSAIAHGLTRRQQGYSAAMIVEESRILQVCIFHMLQKNLATIDFSILLFQIMTIADEVDSQLRQAMECYVAESSTDSRPV